MAEKVSDRVGNYAAGEYEEKAEGPTGPFASLFGVFLGLTNHWTLHFLFLLSYVAFKLYGGDNNVPLTLFLFFFFYALGSVVFLFVSPLFPYLTVGGFLAEAFFLLLALLSATSFEAEKARDVFTASAALLGLCRGLNKATSAALMEATPFTARRSVDVGLMVSGVHPLVLYMIFKFGVAQNEELSKENLRKLFVTVTALGLVYMLVTAVLTLVYSATGSVKRYVEKKRLENDTKPKFVARHAGALFNNMLVSALVFLAFYFMKYCVYPMFYPVDASKKVAVGYKYLFLTLPGLMDGLSRVSFVYLFGRVDWSLVSPFKNLYMLVFDVLLVVYFSVLHNLQDQDFVLFEETFSMLFFLAFMLLHAATVDVVTLQLLSYKDKDDSRDVEASAAQSGPSRTHKRVTANVFMAVLESVGSTLGSLLTLLLFNLQPDKK